MNNTITGINTDSLGDLRSVKLIKKPVSISGSKDMNYPNPLSMDYKDIFNELKKINIKEFVQQTPDIWVVVKIKQVTSKDGTVSKYPYAGPVNQVSLARLLSYTLKGTVRHIDDGSIKGKFIVWDGNRWLADENANSAVSNIVNEFTAALNQLYQLYIDDTEVIETVDDCDIPKNFFLKALAEKSMGITQKILDCLRGQLRLSDEDKKNHDASETLMAFKNGVTCDFSYKALKAFCSEDIPFWRASSPEDNIEMVAGCDFNPMADAKKWLKFIDEIMLGNHKMINYLQMVMGKMLIANSHDAELYLFYGHDGRNGKTVLVNSLMNALGKYATAISPQSLSSITEKSLTPNPALANCAGKRFISCSENSESEMLSAQVIKSLTGGTKITARRLYSNDPEFEMKGVMVIDTNYKPTINDSKIFTTKRMVVIPFNRTFRPEEQNTALSDELKEEASGIINYMIIGLCKYYKYKIEESHSFIRARPDEILSETEEYQAEEDKTQQFIEYALDKISKPSNESLPTSEWEKIDGNYCTGKDLYKIYRYWSKNELGATQTKGITKFLRSLTDHGVKVLNRVWTYNYQFTRSKRPANIIPGYRLTDEAKGTLSRIID